MNHDDDGDDSGMSVWWKVLVMPFKKKILKVVGWRGVREREKKSIKIHLDEIEDMKNKLRRDAKGNCFLQSYLDQFCVWVDVLNESTMWPNCW